MASFASETRARADEPRFKQKKFQADVTEVGVHTWWTHTSWCNASSLWPTRVRVFRLWSPGAHRRCPEWCGFFFFEPFFVCVCVCVFVFVISSRVFCQFWVPWFCDGDCLGMNFDCSVLWHDRRQPLSLVVSTAPEVSKLYFIQDCGAKSLRHEEIMKLFSLRCLGHLVSRTPTVMKTTAILSPVCATDWCRELRRTSSFVTRWCFYKVVFFHGRRDGRPKRRRTMVMVFKNMDFRSCYNRWLFS